MRIVDKEEVKKIIDAEQVCHVIDLLCDIARNLNNKFNVIDSRQVYQTINLLCETNKSLKEIDYSLSTIANHLNYEDEDSFAYHLFKSIEFLKKN